MDLVGLRGQASSPALRGLGRVQGLCLCPVLGPSEVLEDLEDLEEPRELVVEGLRGGRTGAARSWSRAKVQARQALATDSSGSRRSDRCKSLASMILVREVASKRHASSASCSSESL